MSNVDLSTTSVFLDVDGTVSEADTQVHLLDRLVGDSWREIEDQYERKLIGSRECIVREWALLPTTEEHVLRAVAAEVLLDPDFGLLVDRLRHAGAEVTSYRMGSVSTCGNTATSSVCRS